MPPRLDWVSEDSCDEPLASVVGHLFSRTQLSEREQQVLLLAARGLADKEIATRLDLAYTTVKTYWSRISSKLGVKNRQLAIGKLVDDLATMACTRKDTHSSELECPRTMSEDVGKGMS